MELLLFPVIIFFIAIAALSVLLHFVPIGLWISALAADVNISPVSYTHLTLPTTPYV